MLMTVRSCPSCSVFVVAGVFVGSVLSVQMNDFTNTVMLEFPQIAADNLGPQRNSGVT